MAQLMVSKINFFCQMDPYRDIRRGIPNFTACQEVEKWQWLIVSMWHLSRYLEKLQFMLSKTSQISNLRSQDKSKEIPWDLVKKDVAEFSDKFFHFQYTTLDLFKGALNNYSVLKLRLLISTYTFPMYCKNVSHQYYVTNQDTKPHILS